LPRRLTFHPRSSGNGDQSYGPDAHDPQSCALGPATRLP
jgi:hypothetical protein